jgi:hypothetical protein
MRKATQKKSSTEGKSALLACIAIDKNIRKSSVVGYLAKKVLDEYNQNKLHYNDMCRFFFSEAKANKEYSIVCFSDLPPKERKRISLLYRQFRDFDTSEIFAKLGTASTTNCKYSPLEAKWAYTYFKKFKSWEYHAENMVTKEEILQPLSKKELKEYLSLF